jgi:hypothetical protein
VYLDSNCENIHCTKKYAERYRKGLIAELRESEGKEAMSDKWKEEARAEIEAKLGTSIEKVIGEKEWIYETMRARAKVARLLASHKKLVEALTNCRNGLELILGEHKPARPDDPWDTINELRETVRKSTTALREAEAITKE